MRRPRIVDFFCKAGGAARGYADAGFEVVGVDIEPQPNYPFEFYQDDVLRWLSDPHLEWTMEFDAAHASPPCQGYSTVTPRHRRPHHDLLIGEVRKGLEGSGLPYIIENVQAAVKDMVDPVRLCGSSFGLDVRRHRFFEANWDLVGSICDHGWQTPRFQSLDNSMRIAGRLASVVGVHGSLNYAGERAVREKAMGIDWMTVPELAEALPPAYTEFVGQQLLKHLESRNG